MVKPGSSAATPALIFDPSKGQRNGIGYLPTKAPGYFPLLKEDRGLWHVPDTQLWLLWTGIQVQDAHQPNREATGLGP